MAWDQASRLYHHIWVYSRTFSPPEAPLPPPFPPASLHAALASLFVAQHLEALMWLRTLKCPLDEDTFRQAFYNGSVFRHSALSVLAIATCTPQPGSRFGGHEKSSYLQLWMLSSSLSRERNHASQTSACKSRCTPLLSGAIPPSCR